MWHVVIREYQHLCHVARNKELLQRKKTTLNMCGVGDFSRPNEEENRFFKVLAHWDV